MRHLGEVGLHLDGGTDADEHRTGTARLFAAHRDLPVTQARGELDDAARRAGVPVVLLARVLVLLHHGR